MTSECCALDKRQDTSPSPGFLLYLSSSSLVPARGSEQSRGFGSSSIQWPLSVYVISWGWKTDLVSLEGGEALLALIRTELCNHSNIHLSLQMKGEGLAAFCFVLCISVCDFTWSCAFSRNWYEEKKAMCDLSFVYPLSLKSLLESVVS